MKIFTLLFTLMTLISFNQAEVCHIPIEDMKKTITEYLGTEFDPKHDFHHHEGHQGFHFNLKHHIYAEEKETIDEAEMKMMELRAELSKNFGRSHFTDLIGCFFKDNFGYIVVYGNQKGVSADHSSVLNDYMKFDFKERLEFYKDLMKAADDLASSNISIPEIKEYRVPSHEEKERRFILSISKDVQRTPFKVERNIP